MEQIISSINIQKADKSNLVPQYGQFRIRDDIFLYVPLKKKCMQVKSFKLYSPSNVYKKLYIYFLKLFLYTPLRKVVFKSKIKISIPNKLCKEFNKIDGFDEFCLYTGSLGKYRKYSLQLMDRKGDVLAYAKMARTPFSINSIDNEKKTLLYLKHLSLNSSYIPDVLFYDDCGILIQSSTKDLKKVGMNLNDIIVNSLVEIFNKTKYKLKLHESNIISKLKYLNNVELKEIKEISNKAIQIYESQKDRIITYSLAHKDFAPWNIRLLNNCSYIFDWEFAESNIAYYDIFSYVCLVEIMVRKSASDKIVSSILNNKYIDKFEMLTGLSDRKFMFYLYLIDLIHFYYTNLSENGEHTKNFVLTSTIKIIDRFYEEYLEELVSI